MPTLCSALGASGCILEDRRKGQYRRDSAGRPKRAHAADDGLQLGNVENVRVVMDSIGPDKVAHAITECDNSFCNALHFSAGGGHSDVVFLLIEKFRGSGGDLPS